jgi:RNA polymerase sigma-70 factor (ECF subfamily)
LKSYLLIAVKNHALNMIQRKKASVASLSSSFIDLPEEEVSSAYEKEELAVKILQAIDELPPRCKTIFEMAYREGMSYQKIADKLKISKNSVKTQMGIAYRSLRTKISPSMVVLFLIIHKLRQRFRKI